MNIPIVALGLSFLLISSPVESGKLPSAALKEKPVQTAMQESPSGKYYPDGHGGEVYFPLGDLSFADEVVSFQSGNPAASNERDRNPKLTLGVPDYDKSKDINYCTLGCGGVLVLRFVDNALTDIEGPDLYVFEIGPQVEPTDLAISEDGLKWTEVGKVSGGTAYIDINKHVNPGQVFHFVRLTDLKSGCGGNWPGADIDAVGAIGSVIQFSLSSSVLFDFNKFDLKPEARPDLSLVVEEIKKHPDVTIVVEGHTDSVGSDEKNLDLSIRRAESIRDFLKSSGLQDYEFEIKGYGESRPVASNDTEEGRAKNRRVAILIIQGAIRK
jgi:outer membrane protein OmpA-like peptidoglycan-associated protein